jgi:hypothetical protein
MIPTLATGKKKKKIIKKTVGLIYNITFGAYNSSGKLGT